MEGGKLVVVVTDEMVDIVKEARDDVLEDSTIAALESLKYLSPKQLDAKALTVNLQPKSKPWSWTDANVDPLAHVKSVVDDYAKATYTVKLPEATGDRGLININLVGKQIVDLAAMLNVYCEPIEPLTDSLAKCIAETRRLQLALSEYQSHDRRQEMIAANAPKRQPKGIRRGG